METFSFQIGGGLPSDAPTYITRAVDATFVETVRAGEYCYVLNARQMGKSSLRNKAIKELRALGVVCAAIDVSVLADDKDPVSLWCAGLIDRINARFQLFDAEELRNWWDAGPSSGIPMSPIRRLDEFIETVLLAKVNGPCALFLDEIDSVLGTEFGQALFALVRSMHDRRSDIPAFRRLTVVLIGVASPDELMPDARRSPFNIGRPIGLHGFTYSEAAPVLGPILATRYANSESVLRAILAQTGGQPFLTQKLAELVMADEGLIGPGDEGPTVRRIVGQHITQNWEAQDEPPHLRTIRDRLLFEKLRVVRRLDVLARLHGDKAIPFDGSREQLELRLSGVAGDQNGALVIANEIYRTVFNEQWVAERLGDVRPYASALAEWVQSGRRDQGALLRGETLAAARRWAEGRTLSQSDYDFIDSSSALETKTAEEALATERQANQLLKNARAKAERRVVIGSMILGITVVLSLLIALGLESRRRATDAASHRATAEIRERAAAASRASAAIRDEARLAQAAALNTKQAAEEAKRQAAESLRQLRLAQEEAHAAQTEAELQRSLAEQQGAASRLQQSRANALKLVDAANRQSPESPLLATRLLIEALVTAPREDEETRSSIRTRIKELASMGRISIFPAEPVGARVSPLEGLGLVVISSADRPGDIRRIDDWRPVTSLPQAVRNASILRDREGKALPEYFSVGYVDGTYDLRRGRLGALIASQIKSIGCESQQLLCVTYSNGKTELRRTSDGQVIDTLPEEPSGFITAANVPFVITNFDKAPSQLRRTTGELVETLASQSAESLHASADRSLIAISYEDPQNTAAEIWELRAAGSGKLIALSSTARWIQFGPTNSQVAVGYRDHPVELRGQGGRVIASLSGRIDSNGNRAREKVVFNATGSTFAVAYDDTRGEIRDATGTIRAQLETRLFRAFLSKDATIFGLEYVATPVAIAPVPTATRGRRSRTPEVVPPAPPPPLPFGYNAPEAIGPVEVRDALSGALLHRTQGANIRFAGSGSLLLISQLDRPVLYNARRRESIPLPATLINYSSADSFFVSEEERERHRVFRAETGNEIPVPAGWTASFLNDRFEISPDGRRYVTPWGDLRDGTTDDLITGTVGGARAAFNRQGSSVVVCGDPFVRDNKDYCELRRAADGALLRRFENGLTFESWSASGEMLFLRRNSREGELWDSLSGKLLAGAVDVSHVGDDLAVVLLPNRSSELWTTSKPRRLSPFDGEVDLKASYTSGDRVLLWPQNRGTALIVDHGWARRAPPNDADDSVLLEWACEPLRGTELSRSDTLKKFLDGNEPSGACSVVK